MADKEAMAISAAANMKRISKDASIGERSFSKGDLVHGVNMMISILGNIEDALSAVEAATGLRADLESTFTNLRSDVRLFRQDMEDQISESEASAQVANEVMEAKDYQAEINVENIVSELLCRGVFVAVGPGGMPTRKEGVFALNPREGSTSDPNSVVLRLVGEGKWMDTRRVNAEEYLRSLSALPKEATASEVWSAGGL